MAESASAASDVIGSAEIDVHARVDTLENDLKGVKSTFEKFDASTAGSARRLKQFEDSSNAAAGATRKYGQAVAATQSSVNASASANDNLVASQRQLSKELASTNDALTKFKAANDNATRSNAAANQSWKTSAENAKDTAKSFFETGVKILEVAGYIKLAAAVAHAASPALRGIVASGLDKWGATVAPVLGKVGATLGALTPGFIKTSSAVTGFTAGVAKATETMRPLLKVSEAVDLVMMGTHFPLAAAGAIALSPALREVASHEIVEGIKSIGPSIATIGPPALAVSKSVGSVLLPTLMNTLAFVSKIAVPVTLAVAAWELLKFSVEEAGERIKKASELLKKATETGLSTDFIQRAEIFAKKLDISVKSITDSMKKFQESVKPQALSFELKEHDTKDKPGEGFKQRLDELVKLGNFAKNEFVEAFNKAQTTEEKWRAAIALITKAGGEGQRLAALNLGSTFLSDDVMARLRANPMYLQQAQEAADKISKTKLISVDNIALAADLKKRLEEAEKILSERWIPFQEKIIALGLHFKSVWVSTLEVLAAALTAMEHMPDWVGKTVNTAAKGIPIFGNLLTVMEAINSAGDTKLRDAAMQRLTEGLLQPEKIRQTNSELMDFYQTFKVFADASKLVKPIEIKTDNWDKEIARISRHTAVLQADAASVDRTTKYNEQLRTELQLLEAASRDDSKITSEKIANYTLLRTVLSQNEALIAAGIVLTSKLGGQFKNMSEQAGAAKEALDRQNASLKILNDLRANEISTRALTARTPEQKGDIAAQQKRLEMEQDLKKGIVDRANVENAAASARKLVIDTELQQLTEAQRVRELNSKQTVDSAKVEIASIGKSVGETYRLQTVEQARQQLEQEAASSGLAFDSAKLARLTKLINQTAELKQQQAELKAQDDALFEKQTMYLDETERSIAAINRQLHGNAWQDFMNDGLSASLRLNASLKDTRDLIKDFGSTLLSSLQQGKTLTDSLVGSFSKIGQALTSKGVERFSNAVASGDYSKMFGNEDLASGKGALGMAGAGFSGYESGKQGGSILGGALSGAMAGSAFGPWGAAAGAAIGAIGTALGQSAKKAEEAKKKFEEAQAKWKAMAEEFAKFTEMLKGTVKGDLTKSLEEAQQQAQKFADAAHEAGEATGQLEQDLIAFKKRMVGEFIAGFDLLIEALDSGLGFDSPAVRAAGTVKEIGKQLQSLIADAQTVAGYTSPAKKTASASDFVGGMFGVMADTLAKAIEAANGTAEMIPIQSAAVDKARESAQAFALSLLGTQEPLTKVEERLLTLRGASNQLFQTLQDLGMSATEAATAISAGVNKELDKIRTEFTDDIGARINEALGKGFLNQISGLRAESAKMFTDAKLLGVDPTLVGRYFAVQAQKIVDEAGLVGDSFNDLITTFPELSGVVHESTTALKEQIDFFNDLRKTIDSFITGLNLGPLTTLSPGAQLEQARKAFESQLSSAQGGDRDALSGITGTAQTFLEQARKFFGPSSDFGDIFKQVTDQLQALPDAAQVDPVVEALTETNATLASLELLQNATKGISSSIEDSTKRLGQQSQDIALSQSSQYFGPMTTYLSQIEANTRLSGTPAPPPDDGFDLFDVKTWFSKGGVVGRYEGGGVVGNGMRGIDSVLARYATGGSIELAGGEYVMPSGRVNAGTLPALEAMRRGGGAVANDNSAVVSALSATNNELRQLRSENRVLMSALMRLAAGGNDLAGSIVREVSGLRTDTRQVAAVTDVRKKAG